MYFSDEFDALKIKSVRTNHPLCWWHLPHDEAPGPYITIPQYRFNKTKQHAHMVLIARSSATPIYDWLLLGLCRAKSYAHQPRKNRGHDVLCNPSPTSHQIPLNVSHHHPVPSLTTPPKPPPQRTPYIQILGSHTWSLLHYGSHHETHMKENQRRTSNSGCCCVQLEIWLLSHR